MPAQSHLHKWSPELPGVESRLGIMQADDAPQQLTNAPLPKFLLPQQQQGPPALKSSASAAHHTGTDAKAATGNASPDGLHTCYLSAISGISIAG